MTWRRADVSDVYHGPCDACGKCDAHPDDDGGFGTCSDALTDCDLSDAWIDDDRNLLCGTCITGIDFPDDFEENTDFN